MAVVAFLGVTACGPSKPSSTPTADIVKTYGPWSYCQPPATISLSHENASALESSALLGRTDAPYDVLLVPGYTPADADAPFPRVHPIAAARLDEAIALYREGKAKLLLVSGGAVHPENTPYTEGMAAKTYLLDRGISESAIVVEPCARHSMTNLRNAGRFMLKYHLRTALVVTSADQAFYFANGDISTFEIRSRAVLGYAVGNMRSRTVTTLEFAPSGDVLRRGTDPRDP